MKRNFKKRQVKTVIIRTILLVVEIALAVFFYLFPQLFITNKMGDIYSRYVFPVITLVPNTFCNLFMTSLTEMIVVIGSIALLIIVVGYVVKLIKHIKRKGYRSGYIKLIKTLNSIGVIVLCMTIVFQMMHGMNYRRTSPQAQLGIRGEEYSYEECCEALEWAYNGMVDARSKLGSDYNGVSHLMTSVDECIVEANSLLDSFSREYDLGLSGNFIRAKAVMLSRPWRYTGIVGVYDVFLGEANVSTDYVDALNFPVTLCHEIAHAKGYARETDCNIIADLACIHSSRADFRYAGYVDIYVRIANVVYKYADDLGYDLPWCFGYPEEVRCDIRAYNRYSDYFVRDKVSETIENVSESVNNTFLESNGQEGGTETYVVPTEIYVDFYFKYVNG